MDNLKINFSPSGSKSRSMRSSKVGSWNPKSSCSTSKMMSATSQQIYSQNGGSVKKISHAASTGKLAQFNSDANARSPEILRSVQKNFEQLSNYLNKKRLVKR
jgi:hypothetical protein